MQLIQDAGLMLVQHCPIAGWVQFYSIYGLLVSVHSSHVSLCLVPATDQSPWTLFTLIPAVPSFVLIVCVFKGELQCKINLWSIETLVPSQPFSEICFHDNRI